MADGGFLIKFDGKEVGRCYSVTFDYDEWIYLMNDKEKKPLPKELNSIAIEVER